MSEFQRDLFCERCNPVDSRPGDGFCDRCLVERGRLAARPTIIGSESPTEFVFPDDLGADSELPRLYLGDDTES